MRRSLRAPARLSRPMRAAALYAAACWGLLAVITGCFGGQTGTEAAPSRGTGGAAPETKETGTDSAQNGTVSAPSANASCNESADAVVDLGTQTGLSPTAVLDFVQGANPIVIRYADGNASTATMQLALVTNSCVMSTSGAPASLRVPVTLQLTSADGRLALAMTGWATAEAAEQGGVGEVELNVSRQCDRSAGDDSMLACAIQGVDASSYAAVSLDLSVRVQSVGGATLLLGTLRGSGSASASCATEPCIASNWVAVTSIALSKP